MNVLDDIKNIINPFVDDKIVSFGAIIATKDDKDVIRHSYIMVDPINKITLVMGFQSFDDKKWEYVWKLKDMIFNYLRK